MKSKILLIFFLSIILSGCAGVSSKGIFGTGVSVAFDPRSVGTQIDDSIMQKSLTAKILLLDKSYFLSVKSKVLDGRIFLNFELTWDKFTVGVLTPPEFPFPPAFTMVLLKATSQP